MNDAPSAMHGFSDIVVTVARRGERCLTPEVQHLVDWWWDVEEGRVRLRSEFDIVDHVLLIPHVSYTERLADETFRIRVVGEELKHLVGAGRQGEVVTPSSRDEKGWRLHDHYLSVAHRRVPLRCVGTLSFADRSHTRFESVDCPLAASDGWISRIVGVLRVVRSGL